MDEKADGEEIVKMHLVGELREVISVWKWIPNKHVEALLIISIFQNWQIGRNPSP